MEGDKLMNNKSRFFMFAGKCNRPKMKILFISLCSPATPSTMQLHRVGFMKQKRRVCSHICFLSILFTGLEENIFIFFLAFGLSERQYATISAIFLSYFKINLKKMKNKTFFTWTVKLILSSLLLSGVIACSEDENEPEPMTFTFNFNNDIEDWIAGFADYPAGEEEFYELLSGYSVLPAPLDETNGAYKISGNNHSDDLFMFIKRKVTGLRPNTTYDLYMEVEFATNIPDGSIGVGGSPGESVYIKGGASTQEPDRLVDNLNWYRMTIDKANQAQSGKDMLVLGDFSNDTDLEEYILKTVINKEIFTATSNENGEMWLIVGTDSGFESTTTIFYNRIEFALTP